MNDSEKIAEFKKRTLPYLEDLLQLALWLTKNGCEAIGLTREAMAEAYWTWDESMRGDQLKVRQYEILTKQFSAGSQGAEDMSDPVSGAGVDDSLVENRQPFLESTINAQRQSWVSGNTNEVVNYQMAIAGLPEVCRSAMILSYLEEFTDEEIADLAGTELHTVESVLSSGRNFIRGELFEVLMGSNFSNAVEYREAASG